MRDSITFSEEYRLKKMARLVEHCATVVDLGCAQSPNLYLKNDEVVGVDLEAAKMPSNYSRFYQGTIREVQDRIGKVDAVVLGEVLEHVEDPIGLLRDVGACLDTNGIIVLSTPNPNSPIEALLNLFFIERYFYTREHIMLFPQRWLKRMLEVAGFESVEILSGGFPVPFIGLVPFPRPWCYQSIAVAKINNA